MCSLSYLEGYLEQHPLFKKEGDGKRQLECAAYRKLFNSVTHKVCNFGVIRILNFLGVDHNSNITQGFYVK